MGSAFPARDQALVPALDSGFLTTGPPERSPECDTSFKEVERGKWK